MASSFNGNFSCARQCRSGIPDFLTGITQLREGTNEIREVANSYRLSSFVEILTENGTLGLAIPIC